MERKLTIYELLRDTLILKDNVLDLLLNYTNPDDVNIELNKIKKSLLNDIKILERTMGMFNKNTSGAEIADKLHIHPSSIKLIEKRAVNKMKHIKNSKKIREYLRL